MATDEFKALLDRMIAAGTRLGPYEIIALLGAGGPASVSGARAVRRELRRGLAEAKPGTHQ